MSIKFKNREHEKFYEQCLARIGSLDPYHKAFFYTMGISGETRKHIEDVFNFREDAIRPEGMNKGWQTSGTSCLTRLAFNLWNGWKLPDPLGVQPLERVERGWLRDALRSVHHFGCNLHVGSGSASVPGVLQGTPGPQYESGQIRWDRVERKNSEIKANARKDLRP